MESREFNVLALAYLGDAIYEIYIRKYLLSKGIQKVQLLQEKATCFVSAKNQEKYLKVLLLQSFFTEEEIAIIYRARNHKGKRHPKHTALMTYKYATGLEALIGYLYLEKKKDRIDAIMEKIIGD